MRLLPLVACAQAFRFVENEHPIPGIFSSEQYNVQFVPHPPPIDENVSEDRIMRLAHLGVQYTCLLPGEIDYNESIDTVNKTAVDLARSIIKNLNKHEFMEFDDVWGWQFELGSQIIQFLPQRVFSDGVLEMRIGKAFTTVGRSSNISTHNVNTTEPRFVGDQLMMRATFDQGSICDLSLLPRVSYVYFTCSRDCGKYPVCLLQASEPESNCKYEFVLGLEALCDIPEFVKHHSVTNQIVCGVDDPAGLADLPGEEAYVDTQFVNK